MLGATLACCCSDVRGSGIGTGFYRDGHCSTGQDDVDIAAVHELEQFSERAAVLLEAGPEWAQGLAQSAQASWRASPQGLTSTSRFAFRRSRGGWR